MIFNNSHVGVLNGKRIDFHYLVRVYSDLTHEKVATFENLENICDKVNNLIIPSDVSLTTDCDCGNNFNGLKIIVLKDITHLIMNIFEQLFHIKKPIIVRSLNNK